MKYKGITFIDWAIMSATFYPSKFAHAFGGDPGVVICNGIYTPKLSSQYLQSTKITFPLHGTI